ncbi:hypothetical protein LINPERHAP1_LOCUS40587 [Linum perenne]
MNASGMGWNADKSCCECDPDIFAGWVKVLCAPLSCYMFKSLQILLYS